MYKNEIMPPTKAEKKHATNEVKREKKRLTKEEKELSKKEAQMKKLAAQALRAGSSEGGKMLASLRKKDDPKDKKK